VVRLLPGRFEPSRETPYFAIVAMDGDRMAEILGWREDRLASRDAEAFHRDLSRALSGFAASLRTAGSADLNLEALRRAPLRGRRNPQLVYAGGEDVLLVCDPRDALGLAWKIRDAYREALRPVVERHASPDDRRRFTISAAVLFAHTKHPAGLLFRDAQELLKKKAKQEEGRNAVALRLAKRGGVPVETAFPWDEPAGDGDGRPTWVESFDALVGDLATGALSSRQTFNLRRDDRVLAEVFQTEEEWSVWLRDRLSRREPAAGIDIGRTAGRLAPFFRRGKTEALRILRFLVREVREAGEASR
jgi:CRISPR-associated protein Cmr2